jgi:hypothetical protein
MKLLLIITAVFEGMVGFALFVLPGLTTSTFLNITLDVPIAAFFARLAGGAILSLAICCWKARNFNNEGASIGIVTAMFFYNFAAAAVLVYGGMRLGLQSPLIWPAIVLHAALGVWCATLVWFAMHRHPRQA